MHVLVIHRISALILEGFIGCFFSKPCILKKLFGVRQHRNKDVNCCACPDSSDGGQPAGLKAVVYDNSDLMCHLTNTTGLQKKCSGKNAFLCIYICVCIYIKKAYFSKLEI